MGRPLLKGINRRVAKEAAYSPGFLSAVSAAVGVEDGSPQARCLYSSRPWAAW
jgi:hypothetical protein